MSNRLTFSLASLIFLIALGLVFVPVSVMAHEVTPANSAAGLVHETDTPVQVVTNGVVTTPGNTNHGAHPTVTSIALKEGAKVRGNMVAVTDPAGGAAADAQFTLVITFDQEVVSASTILSAAADNDGATPPVDTVVLTGADDFTETVTLANNAATSGEVTIADATRVEGSNNQFEAVATLATAFPTGASGAAAFRLRVSVDARSAFSPQTHPLDELNPIPGGASEPSTVYAFTLVNALPMADDTDAPTVSSIMDSAPDATSGNVTFTITFSEAVTGFTLGDLEVENGSAVDFGGTGMTYTLEVAPEAGKKVTVSFADDAMVADAADNALNVSVANMMSGVYTPEGYVPTVAITAAAGTGDDEGKVIFTLSFTETPNAFSVASLTVTGAEALEV